MVDIDDGAEPQEKPSSPPPGPASRPPDGRTSNPPPGPVEGEDDGPARRKRLERLLRETIRRGLEKGIEAGLGTWTKTDEALRGVVGDVKLPREIVSYVFSQIEETKNGMVRVVAREVREFLEATDLATELQKALTSLSFEIKTEIRFIPNDAGTGVKPQVKSSSVPRRIKRKGDAEESASSDGDEP